jgi:hypothetical protein
VGNDGLAQFRRDFEGRAREADALASAKDVQRQQLVAKSHARAEEVARLVEAVGSALTRPPLPYVKFKVLHRLRRRWSEADGDGGSLRECAGRMNRVRARDGDRNDRRPGAHGEQPNCTVRVAKILGDPPLRKDRHDAAIAQQRWGVPRPPGVGREGAQPPPQGAQGPRAEPRPAVPRNEPSSAPGAPGGTHPGCPGDWPPESPAPRAGHAPVLQRGTLRAASGWMERPARP